MQTTIFLPSREDILMLHDLVLLVSHGRSGILHDGYIDAALNRPYTRMQYEDDVSLHIVVATLIDSLARNHAFNDGNKRTALMIGIYTYSINEIFLDFTKETNDEFEELVLWVVNEKPDIQTIAKQLQMLVDKHEQGSMDRFFTSFRNFLGIS